MKTHIPRVSILLATYNGEAYINEQLNSIQKQVDVEVSIVASDDCSIDETLKLLNEARDAGCRMVMLPTEKQGNAAANFFRLIRDTDLTNVDYIALSDQDDIWQSNKLSKAIEQIEKDNVDAYSSNVTAFWPDGKQSLINKAQPQQKWDYMFESAGPGCSFVLTKRLAEAIQQFLIERQDECNRVALHDWFIYAFARSRGYQWYIDSATHILYRQHAENVVGANVGFKAKIARWESLREGWLVEQALLIAQLLGYIDSWPMLKLKRYHFTDRMVLVANVRKLRRRWRDSCALAVFLLFPFRK